jgi:hypothetical protein
MAGSGFLDFLVAGGLAAMVSPHLPGRLHHLPPARHGGKLTFTKTRRAALQKFQLTRLWLI